MSPLVLCATAALLLAAASVEAVYGPETAATATDFPQLIGIKFTSVFTMALPAAIISSRFAITSQFMYPDDTNIVVAYSGDLSNSANTVEHSVVRIKRFSDKFSIVKVCPPLTNYQTISLIESDNFNYQSNTTGKVVYWRLDDNKLYYRTADVLTDDACIADNAAAPIPISYTALNQTCAKYDPADESCKQLNYMSGERTTHPMLMPDAKTVAIYSPMTCKSGSSGYKTNGIAVFHKAFYLKSLIVPFATVDLA